MANGFSSAEELWSLTPDEHSLVMSKSRVNWLGFAILLTFFREYGRFPRREAEIEPQAITVLSRQLDVATPVDGTTFLTGRTAERLRGEIRVRFGFREASVADADMLAVWLRDHVAGEVGGEIASMILRLEGRCRELAIEPPTTDRIERITRTALRAHEEQFHTDIYERLPAATRERLDELLQPDQVSTDASVSEDAPGNPPAVLLKLLGNPGRPSLASMQDELTKLELIRAINLPSNLFDRASPRDVDRCRRRVSVEAGAFCITPRKGIVRLQAESATAGSACISVSSRMIASTFNGSGCFWNS